MKQRAYSAAGWCFGITLAVSACGHDSGVRRADDAGSSGDASLRRDADLAIPTDAASGGSSLEFGAAWEDIAIRDDAPAGGTLFSVWTRIPNGPPSYPWQRGNMDVYVLYGPGWHLRCLTGNMIVRSPTSAYYNANSMLFVGAQGTWVDDYSYYAGDTPHGEEDAVGWVFAAWHVVVTGDRFVIRQWLKYGLDGAVFAAGENSPTFAEIRAKLVYEKGWSQQAADAWVPGDASNFQIGRDHAYLVQARMTGTDEVPSLATLDAYALATAGDGAAWADYRLGYVDGAPDLTDRSGHGRHLRLAPGGTLGEGIPAPEF